MPLPSAVTTSQLPLLDAVHAQPVADDTPTVPVVAAAPTERLIGVNVVEQPAATCETVNDRPAMVTVPLRGDAAGLACTLNATLPLPEPLAPPVTLSHDALLTAVQPQPPGATTLVDTAPPAAADDCDDDDRSNEHEAPACVTVNAWPPIVSVPVRAADDALAAALNDTVPLPLPLAAPAIDSHDPAFDDAVQAQPAGAVTEVEPLPPPGATDWLPGAIAKLHEVPAWVTANARPATVTVADRDVVAPLAATENGTAPAPAPAVAPVSVIHDADVAADQEQPVATLTERLPLPPDAAAAWLDGETLATHGGWNEKLLDAVLVPTPPGPIAVTRAS